MTILLRHASAGDRDEWDGDDRARPLDPQGRARAEQLVAALEPYGIRRIVSSPYRRCTQTVEPLARALGSSVESDDRIAEGASRDDVLALAAESDAPTVLCTHGDVVEAVLGRDLRKGEFAEI